MHPTMPIVTSPELLVRVENAQPQSGSVLGRLPAFYPTAKRAIDVAVSLGMLVVLSPLLLLVALLIKLDGGPVVFRQTRVGKDGREFTFFKFRSMVVNADAYKQALMILNEHKDDRTFKMKHDPRITRVGRVIRKTSIDELPQLFNILRGEMTLVGPRPAVPSEVAKYTPHERHRLEVTPGLTCTWQVSGRADLDFSQQVELDLDYIKRRSLWTDFKLMLKTIPAVLSGKGAY